MNKCLSKEGRRLIEQMEWMEGWIDGWMGGRMDEWMDGKENG